MIISWYTIIFQLINFIILVFLLKRFLYGPVIKVMAEREQKIAAREEEARTKRLEAEEEAEALRTKNESLEKSRAELFEKAVLSAEEEKARLIDEARQSVEETRHHWEDALRKEQQAFAGQLRLKIGRQVSALARRCLNDLADARLEELVLEQFLKKIKELGNEELHKLDRGAKRAAGKIIISSAFALSAEQQEKLVHTLSSALGWPPTQSRFTWVTRPELILGLEIEAGGFRLLWNAEHYFEALEVEILKILSPGPSV